LRRSPPAYDFVWPIDAGLAVVTLLVWFLPPVQSV